MDPNNPGRGRGGGPPRPTRGGWKAYEEGRRASQGTGSSPGQGANPAAPADPFGGGGSQRPAGRGGHLTTTSGAGRGILEAGWARLTQATQENVPPHGSRAPVPPNPFNNPRPGRQNPPQPTPFNPFAPGARPAQRPPPVSHHPSHGSGRGGGPAPTTPGPTPFPRPNQRPSSNPRPASVPQQKATAPATPAVPGGKSDTKPASVPPPKVGAPAIPAAPGEQSDTKPSSVTQPTAPEPTTPGGQGTVRFSIDDVNNMVNTQWSAGTRRRVAKILYYKELETILRDEPLLPRDTEITILEVYKGNDRGGGSGVKRRLPDQEATSPSAKRQAVSGSESKPEPAKAGTSTAEVIDLLDSDDDDEKSDAPKVDRFGDPDYEYNNTPGARGKFRYFKISDHPGEWPGPDVGMRFDVDRYRSDLGWPDRDVREVFRAEFADGGKDLYADPWANVDAGLAADNVEWGWQLANKNKCELIRNLPLVESVTFVKHDNFCGKRGIAAGTCYWTAMATHIYGDARHWLRVKAEHLEHFALVLENKEHPRHQLYRELNQKWYPAVGTPGPGTPTKGLEKGRRLLVNMWQVLNLPGVYTPMAILDVSADLYGLYMVVYSHHLPPEPGQEHGPYEDKVYKVAARGAYNARHLGLIFENGNHFQPIIPNDYIHWEFKFPRFTQESTSGLPSTGRTEGVRHPWRSEFGQHDKKIGGQQAPALLDHGFDPTVAAMAVGYPPPREPEDNRGDDDQGGDDAPRPGRKGDHGGGDGRGGKRGGKGGPGDRGPGDKGSGGGKTKDDDDDNNNNNNNDAPSIKAAKESHKRPVIKASEEPNRRLPVLASPTNSEQLLNLPIQNPPPENPPDYSSKDTDDDDHDAEAEVKSGSGSKSGKEVAKLAQDIKHLKEDIAQRDRTFSDQLKRTRQEHEENISKMKKEHDAEIEKLVSENKAKVNKWMKFAEEKDAKTKKETHEVKNAREAIKKLAEEKEKAEQENKMLREEIKQLRAEQAKSSKEPPAEKKERDKPKEVEPKAEKEAEGEKDGVKKETAAPAAKDTKVDKKRKSPETEEVKEEPKPRRRKPTANKKTEATAGKEDTQPDAAESSKPAIGDEGSGVRRSGRVRKQVKRYGQE